MPPTPQASYIPTRLTPIGDGRGLLYISGQTSNHNGDYITGSVPDEVSLERAQDAAKFCALNILAHIEAVIGLDRVEQVAQVIAFVNCTLTFGDQPLVVNGASDLLIEVFGPAGRHARAAIGVNALPRRSTVEMTAVVVVRT